ncbi:hypothetical protein FRC01_001869 [Tulasnella sp. 417]|nr:hypothetical protein FRC01_001869 [Tulasnella sp. 417]
MATTEAETTGPTNFLVNRETRAAPERFHCDEKSPIHNLPPEVLHAIFLQVAGDYRGYYWRLLRLRMVCNYWMEVIDSTPGLWNLISTGLHPALQAMILQNSGNHLLNVEYDEMFWGQEPETEYEFAWLMESSASRWQTLEYHRGNGSRNDTWLSSLPLHSLQRIEIYGFPSTDQRLTLDAPKLSYVVLGRCSLNWSSLSALQVLSLESTYPTFNELTAVLQASPGLSSLSLRETWQESGMEDPLISQASRHIQLSRLRTLEIEGQLTRSTSFLLEYIEAPSLETFTVAGSNRTRPEHCPQLCEAAGRYIGAFPLPGNLTQAMVSITAQDRWIKFSIGERDISLWSFAWNRGNGAPVKRASIASAMKHLDSRVCEQVTTLDISCWDDGEIGGYLHAVHSHFPRIDQVLVMDGGCFSTKIELVLQHLSSPSQMGLSEEWLLPGLAKLEFDLSGSIDADLGGRVLELVDKRREAERTEKIRELKITVEEGDSDPSTVENLRRAVMLFDLTVVRGA